MTNAVIPKLSNLFVDLPSTRREEVFTPLLNRGGCRVERIVSFGQVTPLDEPYCQAWDEWVLVLAGAARLNVEDVETVLDPGDHLLIPAGMRHRVTFTDPSVPTIWLALHFEGSADTLPSLAEDG